MTYLEQRRAFIEAGRPLKEKKIYRINPISEKRKAKLKEKKEINSDDTQWKWFEERRKDLTGKCSNCGGKSCKEDDEKFHFSICHLLPKSLFPSVATHPLNFIELCFWGNNCHGNMDAKTLDLIDMNCFDEIVRKFVAIYPSIEKSERKRIPQVLINYIEVEK